MGLGAIVVVGAEAAVCRPAAQQGIRCKDVIVEPLACAEIMGRSMVERIIERFVRADVDVVSVLMAPGNSYGEMLTRSAFLNVKVELVTDVGPAIIQKTREYSERGIEHSFIAPANVYTETDLFDFFCFHRESRQTITRAVDREGPLELGVVDCARAQETDIEALFTATEGTGSPYFIREYASRLTRPQVLRQLVMDALQGRCAMRPAGLEVKPGIWVDDGAEIHRRARIVAPAYIGQGSKVRREALITRCSSVEKDCFVDYGTVIEDSLILSNTHIGMSVDVCHAVASENRLLNLERGVVLEISDPGVMRASTSVRKLPHRDLGLSHGDQEQKVVVADLHEEKVSAPEAWQLGTNPIQG